MNHEQFKLDNIEGVICLEGLIFIRSAMFQSEDPLVKATVGDMFKYHSQN